MTALGAIALDVDAHVVDLVVDGVHVAVLSVHISHLGYVPHQRKPVLKAWGGGG